MENRNMSTHKNVNNPAMSNNVKKAPKETTSVGVPRNAAEEARIKSALPDGRQIERRNKMARKLAPVRAPRVVTVRTKAKSPFPFAVIFSAVILTLLFLFMIMNYAEIDRYNSEIAQMRSELNDLKGEADKLQGRLDKKDGAITAMEDYIENELGMVKGDTLPKEYVSLLPEDITTVIKRSGTDRGFGVLMSGIGEVFRNFFNN